MIGEVVCAHEPLKAHGVIIIPQGSYRNNTNVRQESDVDICVCCTEPFFADYEYADYGDELTGLETAQYSSPTSRTMLRTR